MQSIRRSMMHALVYHGADSTLTKAPPMRAFRGRMLHALGAALGSRASVPAE